MLRVEKLVEQSAASDLPVLLTGEMGVGTERIAREIHRRSPRAHEPLVELHCACLPEDFFERPSALEAVGGGSLFLEDIGELSSVLQDKLLQLLRRRDALRLGSADHPHNEVRVIAATHHDLPLAVQAGTFSADLYYRLNMLHIHVPPLRAHPEDIPGLLQYFMQEHGSREGWHGELPQDLRAFFLSYEWPGNVSELENAIQRFITLRDPAYVLEELEAQSERARATTDLPPSGRPQSASALLEHGGGYRVDLKEIGRHASDAAEKAAIMDMLSRTLGNKKLAAQRLGVSYKALLYKIHDFGIAEARAGRSHEEPPDHTSPQRT